MLASRMSMPDVIASAILQFYNACIASPFAHTLGTFGLSFLLGTIIGFERQWRQRTAGLRTNVLVALGAAAFSDLGFRLLGADGASRIIAYVVSGIGFLGAGVILKDGANIRGLNTAATLWCSAAVGTFAGSGLPAEAIALTMFVLAGNTVLRPVVNWIDRRPILSDLTEASYRVHAICDPDAVSAVRDLIDMALGEANYPIRDVETLSDSDDFIELAATLLPTTADAEALDQVVASLEASSLVRSATWSVETSA
jgi:putative Mg2+ transporter-C (MgtC) family protein